VPSSPRWPFVVFDLDGTLADTIGLIVDSYQHAFTTVLGEAEDEATIRSWIGQPLIRAFRDRSPDRADELFDTYIRWNHANSERLIGRFAGMGDLLADLRRAGAGVAAATSKRRDSAGEALRLTGLDAYLDVLVTLEDTDEHKPDPAPLLLAVDRLGGTPSRAVYVGDAVVDVQAARRAGMAAVGVTWGAAARDDVAAAQPDVLVETVDELRAALLG
jgi:pyrophosphatase PpaX